MNRTCLVAILILLYGPLRLSWGTPSNTTTNQSATATTNVPPPAATNLPPASEAKPIPAIHGAVLMGAFGGISDGKFSISGRTLKLPAPEPCTNQTPPAAWHRALDFGMIMTQGNSDTLRYSLGIDAVKERHDDLFRLHAQGYYGESEDKTDTKNAIATLRYERKLSEATYALGNVEWMADTIAGLDYRITSILSPGIHLIRTGVTLLNVEAGAGYLAEKKGEDEEGFVAGRFAVTFERILNEHVLIWGTTEYLPKVTDANIFYINSEAGLATILARNLSLTVSLQNRYDNAPFDNKKSSDSVLTTSLSLNF